MWRNWSHRCVYSALTFLCLTMGFQGFVRAAEGDSEQETLQDAAPVVDTEEVVVSATKTPVPISQLTSAVEVITGEDLERRNVKTVVDALRLAQGVAVFSNGGPGSSSNVRIRGGAADHTLVLLDGAIMNSGTLGSFNFANLTTDNIERIEILRGAQSMVWGSDAMGGVVNIVTKKGEGPSTVSGFFEYGSFASIREGGRYSGKTGPFDFSMSLSRLDTAGISSINDRRGAVERDAHRNWQASGRWGLDLPTKGRVDFTVRWMNGDIDFDSPSTFGGPFDVFKLKTSSNQFAYSGVYHQPLTSWWSQTLTLARSEEDSKTQAGTVQQSVVTGAVSPASTFNNTQINTLNNRIEWQQNFQIFDPVLLNLGYQFREQQGENVSLGSPIPETIISSHSGFAQLQLNLWDRLFSTAGLRHDSFTLFGENTTYRVTGGYFLRETGTKVRGSYATGFRVPDINEIRFPNFGNPTLKPETSQSFDAGVDQYFFDTRLRLSAGYFWNRFRDLIVFSANDPACAPFSTFLGCPRNIGSAASKGWEASVQVVLARNYPFLKSLDFLGQYTNILTRDLTNGLRLPRWPVDQWSGVLSYQPIDPLRVNLEVRYVGSRFDDLRNRQSLKAFDVWTLSATYDVTKYVQAYTRVENLFDENYEEILLFGTPVRSIFFGVNVNAEVAPL